MRTFTSRRTHLLVGMLVAAGCTGPKDDTAVDTGPGPEPEPYTISDGLPTHSGPWLGRLAYSRVHPYEWGEKGPTLQVERLSSAASFFDAAGWGVFDVTQEEGCWTDSWTAAWSEFKDIGTELPVQVGDETALHLPANGADGTLYTWRSDTPAQEWAIAPGAAIGMDGVDTTVIVPEPLQITDIATAWYTFDQEGTLAIEWEPPTMGNTWIHVLRQEEDGRFTRCHVRDDGSVTIEYGSRPNRDDSRLFFSRVSSADVDLPSFGRVSVYAEDLVLLDPG